ncbi:hypothetical protein [Streptomyces sp. NPDC001744]|uniref:hypothetical protein n=1 Tax=Streptomyces sp. NPDC001744 TaxID=3364606 RepID=UPI00369C0446
MSHEAMPPVRGLDPRRRGGRSVGQIAEDFDLAETAVRLWAGRAGPARVNAMV